MGQLPAGALSTVMLRRHSHRRRPNTLCPLSTTTLPAHAQAFISGAELAKTGYELASSQHKKLMPLHANVKVAGTPPAFEKAWLRNQTILFVVTGLCYGLTAAGALPPDAGFALTFGGALCTCGLGLLVTQVDSWMLDLKLPQCSCMVTLAGEVRTCVSLGRYARLYLLAPPAHMSIVYTRHWYTRAHSQIAARAPRSAHISAPFRVSP